METECTEYVGTSEVSKITSFRLLKYIVGDPHKIPPSHPEKSHPRPPTRLLFRPMLISCRSCLSLSPLSRSLLLFLFRRLARLKKARHAFYRFSPRNTMITYHDDTVTTNDVDEKRPWFHPPVPFAPCFPPNPVRPAALGGLLKTNVRS